MVARFPQIFSRWRAGELSDAACASSYFLCWQIHLHGERFASRRFRSSPKPDVRAVLEAMDSAAGPLLDRTLNAWFETYQFRGTIPAVAGSLSAWLQAKWQLLLMTRIPSPREVLSMQTEGRRPVTLVEDAERMRRPVLSKADGFAFLVHDLEHAHKFFFDPDLHRRQVHLFVRLERAVEDGLFRPFAGDAEFMGKFDYLISDMNTHPMHSLSYLRAILVETMLRREGKPLDGLLSDDAWGEVNRIIHILAPEAPLPPPRR